MNKMTEPLKQMKGEEFVTKLLAGERDFRRIKLEEGFRAPKDEYSSLITYFNTNTDDFIENPLNFIGADLSRGYFSGLNFSYAKAQGASFERSEFPGGLFISADLQNANFTQARLTKANFSDATLINANFWDADLSSAYLNKADLTQANFGSAKLNKAILVNSNVYNASFSNTNLSKANLNYVLNLDHARDLSSAHFLETIVDRKDLPVLKRAIKDRKTLIYADFFDTYFK